MLPEVQNWPVDLNLENRQKAQQSLAHELSPDSINLDFCEQRILFRSQPIRESKATIRLLRLISPAMGPMVSRFDRRRMRPHLLPWTKAGLRLLVGLGSLQSRKECTQAVIIPLSPPLERMIVAFNIGLVPKKLVQQFPSHHWCQRQNERSYLEDAAVLQ